MISSLNRLAHIFMTIGLLSANAFAQNIPYKGGSGNYTQLVWADEFNYKGAPDSDKWNYEKGYVRNNELQYYTAARKENAIVDNGHLVITALNDSLKIGSNVYPITSASLTSKGKKDWTYGRIEVRAKIPSSRGTWPAIWTLGSDIRTVGWPASGEIDILEHVGYMPDTIHFNVHTEKYNHVKKTGKGTKIYSPAPYKDFHVYAIEWFKDHIDWYMDDAKVFTYNNEGEGTSSWPFDKPQYLILNLAFGGAWGGSRGVDISTLPQKLLIDYVRVYQ
ncbi:MAG TPA: glycoside hydrolase family 16 protein [Flavitalea sp.]|nr:glycoside hydrolase family 16 protein [Flavitalea sp.]